MSARSFLSPGRVVTVQNTIPPTFNVADMEASTGLIGTYRTMGSTQESNSTSKTRGLLNRGFRTYGDSLYYAYLKNLATYPGINPDESIDWPEFQVWHAAYPGKNNTSTNVCIRIQNFRPYWFHKATHAWNLMNTNKLHANTNTWHDLQAFVSGKVTSDRIFQAGNPIPGFPFVLNSADRNAPSVFPDETKYRSLHAVFDGGGASRFNLPAVNNPSGGNLGGFMCTAEVDLFPVSGASFNGNTEILMQLGTDFMYPGGNQAAGNMTFAGGGGWTPNTTSSKFVHINPTIGIKTRVYCIPFWDELVNGSGVSLNTKVSGKMGGSGATKETSAFAEAGGVFWLTHQQLLDYPITIVL